MRLGWQCWQQASVGGWCTWHVSDSRSGSVNERLADTGRVSFSTGNPARHAPHFWLMLARQYAFPPRGYYKPLALRLVLLPTQATAILRWSDATTRRAPELALHLCRVATRLDG